MTMRSASVGGVNRLALAIYYCASQQSGCANNNGNVQSTSEWYAASAGESAFSVSQSYAYDAVNRLTQIMEGSASQSYGYDQPGNRWVSSSAGYAVNSLTPTGSGAYDGATNRQWATCTTRPATRRW